MPLVRRDSKFTIFFIALFALGFLVRLPTFGRPLWLDEAYTAWFSSLPLSQLWTDVPTYETHPPMYYTIVHLWRDAFGATEIALRVPSLIASILTLVLAGLVGRVLRLGPKGDTISLVTMAFVAFNATQVELAQSARPYALQTLAASCAILSFVYLLRKILCKSSEDIALGVVSLALSAGFTLWLHNTSVFIVFSMWIGAALSLLIFARETLPRALVILTIAGLAALSLWSPFIPGFIAQSTGVTKSAFWLTFDWRLVIKAIVDIGGATKYSALPVVCLTGIGLIAMWKSKERPLALFLATALGLPVVILVIVSLLGRPVFIPRLIYWMSPTVLYLAAVGLVSLMYRPYARGAVAVAICGLLSLGLISYYRSVEEDWHGLLSKIASNSAEDDLVVVLPNELQVVLTYYAQTHPIRGEITYVPGPFPFRDSDRTFVGNLGAPRVEAGDIAALQARLQRAKRVWLITRGDAIYDSGHLVRNAVSSGRSATTSLIENSIRAELFQ